MAAKKADPKRRSGCPLNASVEMLGDRWSLLIIRDMMIRGFQTYKEFLASDERIATNILADRLRKLEALDIITTQADAADGRKLTYLLTPKGIDLAPVLAEMVLWAARHEETGNQPLVRALQTNKQGVVTEVRDRWAQKRIHRAGRLSSASSASEVAKKRTTRTEAKKWRARSDLNRQQPD